MTASDRANDDCRLMADAFFRRQLVLSGVTAVVVLGALCLVAWAMAAGDAGQTVFKVTPDGSEGGAVRPVVESSPWAMWALVASLAAVVGVLLLLVAHAVRIARFAFRHQPGPIRESRD